MRAGQRVSLILAAVVLPACQAAAQSLPWPSSSPPRAGATAPWPGAGAPPAATPMPGAVAPPSMSAVGPQMGAGPPPMSPMGPQMGAGPPPMSPQGGGMPPCMEEFTKLREEVQKRGAAAKTASQHKATREEMCKHITAYSAAELKWVKFTEAGISSCGIPAQVAQQLKQVHAGTEQTREKICAAAPTAAAAAPSLSDALGTTRLPETTKSGNGTLDTLTGNAIQR
jgi:hypothetical protein